MTCGTTPSECSGAQWPQCGCGSWVEHLERNPCIEELGRMILADQKRKKNRA